MDKESLRTKQQTNRAVGQPKKRWEDEISDFLKQEETEETKGTEKQRHLVESYKKS